MGGLSSLSLMPARYTYDRAKHKNNVCIVINNKHHYWFMDARIILIILPLSICTQSYYKERLCALLNV